MIFKKHVHKKLKQYACEFYANHPEVKLIAVTGSAGKTSAKIAIATMLSQQYKVLLHEPEPTSTTDVLLQLLGLERHREAKHGILRWWSILRAARKRARGATDVQVVVQEFSPQHVGENEFFRDVVFPDITVVTAVTNGRQQDFPSIEDIAKEMITLANNSKYAVINRDDVDGRFAGFLINPQMTTYGTSEVAEYFFQEHGFSLEAGRTGMFVGPEYPEGLEVQAHVVGEHNIRPLIAAGVVGVKLGLMAPQIISGIQSIQPLPGRMRLLRAADGGMMIDDSYSASPLTALSALQTLYSLEVPQKIVVFGNINGLKDKAQEEMERLGLACSVDELDWVVTVGDMVNQFLAPAARRKGCQVKECHDALEAGGFVREKLHKDGVALYKASSGGAWLEEAVKINLHDIRDAQYLVRQEPEWLERKNAYFSRFREQDKKK